MKPTLIIIVGPTGVGKSEIAVELAEEIGGEIINADSQQVYRHMDIGTAKPSAVDRERVPHHLIDVVDPDEEFDVAIFRRLALRSIDDVGRRGRKAIVCGGTGLYVKALTKGLLVGPAQAPEVRARLKAELENQGLGALYRRLQQIDPAATSWIHPHDRQRIMRALEVFESTGKRMSEWQGEHGFSEERFESLKIGLDRPRQELYDRINRRCEQMVQSGLLEEVRNLRASGYGLNLKTLQSVGYRHMGLVLNGVMSLADALALMQRDTRRLAKRQLTWFRGDAQICWYSPNDRLEIQKDVYGWLSGSTAVGSR
jgi:tRNA dimethylallyltransferase